MHQSSLRMLPMGMTLSKYVLVSGRMCLITPDTPSMKLSLVVFSCLVKMAPRYPPPLHRFSWHSVLDSRLIQLMPVRYSSSVQISENNVNIFLQPCLVGRRISLWCSWFHFLDPTCLCQVWVWIVSEVALKFHCSFHCVTTLV